MIHFRPKLYLNTLGDKYQFYVGIFLCGRNFACVWAPQTQSFYGKRKHFSLSLTVSFTVSIFPQRLWSDKLRNGREPNNGGHLILNQAPIYIDFRIFARWMKLKTLRNICNIFAILSFGFCRARLHFTWHLSLYCRQ